MVRNTRWVLAVMVSMAVVVVAVAPVAFAGAGGSKTGKQCQKGQYVNYQDPQTLQPFTSEEACTASYAQTGTLTPEVDLSLRVGDTITSPAIDPLTGSGCSISPGTCRSVVVQNLGVVAASINLDYSGH